MNNENVKKLQLIRQILFEARDLTMNGYGQIRFECEIVDKQPKGDKDDRTTEI